MKIRKGFVSNSSSSSFICDVCGANESGWDLGLVDAGMIECKNGHTFCEGHIVNKEKYDKMVEASDDPYYDDDIRYAVSEEFCPICSLKSIMSNDIIDYMCKYYKTSRKNVEIAIHKKFKTLKELRNYVKGGDDV